MTTLLYLIGAPGVGKSTLMRELTAGCGRHEVTQPLAHGVLSDPYTAAPVAAELGRSRAGFPGTDTLALNVAPVAAAWVAGRPYPLLLAEGDRLAHIGFLDAARDGGYQVTVAYLRANTATLDLRCRLRGSTQNEAWRRGRHTKAHRLAEVAEAAGHTVLYLDAEHCAPSVLAKTLRAQVPALSVLPEVKP